MRLSYLLDRKGISMSGQVEKTRKSACKGVLRLIGRLGLTLFITLAGYLLIYRPLQLNWGATQEEVGQPMPGDEIQPHPTFNATRAVTISAPPAQVWPWLVQIGYKQAGWYGYDFIDNGGISSAERIVPELQHMVVGDNVPVWEGVNLRVAAVEPNRYLVWQSNELDNPSSWTLQLLAVGINQTRLVWRIHNAPYNWTSPTIVPLLFTDLADFIAVRENLLGIKARAEGVPRVSQSVQMAEIGMWTVTFFSFLAAAGGLVIRRDWLPPMLAVSATGLLTVGLVLSQPPIWVDGLAMLGAWGALWYLYKSPDVAGRFFPKQQKSTVGFHKRVSDLL